MKKELTAVKNKIKKLRDKKALIDEELEPLLMCDGHVTNLTGESPAVGSYRQA